MTRVCISIGILLLLSGLSIFSGIWVEKRCSRIIDEIDTVQELQQAGEYEAAAAKAAELERDWEDFREKSAVLLKNNKLSDADRISERIYHLSLAGDPGGAAESAEMRLMVDSLRKGELPFLTNIF
jgi:hypothetical protein